MGSMKSAPDVPDLGQTINAGVGGNWGMTRANNRATLFGTSSPYGTTTWDKARNAAGKVIKTKYTDPYTGEKYRAPTYNQNITLSPEEQQKYDLSSKAQIGALGKANELMGSMGNFGLDPFDFTKSLSEIGGSIFDPNASNDAVEKRLYDLGSRRLDPRFAREEAGLEANLTARGIRPGTAAYNAARGQFGEGKNDAYNQLALTGRGQAYNELLSGQGQQFGQALANRGRELAERGQYAGEQFGTRDRNIQYLTQLLQAGQPNMPQFTGSQPQGNPLFDYPGAINENWNQQFKKWEAEQAAKGNMFGGAMSGLAGIIGSDERIKDNIKQVGTTQDGLPIYEFSIGDGPMQTGVMAQDVEQVNPGAVVENADGIKGVDYPAAVGDGTGTYTVEKGDSLWDIGARLGVDPREIIAANPEIENPDLIYPGQKLVVPGMAAPSPAAVPLGALPSGGPEAVVQALTSPVDPAQLLTDVDAAAGSLAPGLNEMNWPGGAGGGRPDPTQQQAAPLPPQVSADQLLADVEAGSAGPAPGLSELNWPGGAGGGRPDPTQLIRFLMMSGGMGGY